MKPKKNIASSVTGMTPIASRMRLITISATTNSIGRSGLIIRLPMLRDHISSRNEIEKPSWPRNRMSHSITAPISVPPARGEEAGVLRDVGLQEAPGDHLHGGQYIRSSSRGQDDISRYQ